MTSSKDPFPEDSSSKEDKSKENDSPIDKVTNELRHLLSDLDKEKKELDPFPHEEPDSLHSSEGPLKEHLNQNPFAHASPPEEDSSSDQEFWKGNVLGWSSDETEENPLGAPVEMDPTPSNFPQSEPSSDATEIPLENKSSPLPPEPSPTTSPPDPPVDPLWVDPQLPKAPEPIRIDNETDKGKESKDSVDEKIDVIGDPLASLGAPPIPPGGISPVQPDAQKKSIPEEIEIQEFSPSIDDSGDEKEPPSRSEKSVASPGMGEKTSQPPGIFNQTREIDLGSALEISSDNERNESPDLPAPMDIPIPGSLGDATPPKRGKRVDDDVIEQQDEKKKGVIQLGCIFPEGCEKEKDEFIQTLKELGRLGPTPVTIDPVFVHPWTPDQIDVAGWQEAASLSGACANLILTPKSQAELFSKLNDKNNKKSLTTRLVYLEFLPRKALYSDLLADLGRLSHGTY